jgi:hypothetical protein
MDAPISPNDNSYLPQIGSIPTGGGEAARGANDDLITRLGHISNELAAVQTESRQAQEELAAQASRVDREKEELLRLRAELDQARDGWNEAQSESYARQSLLSGRLENQQAQLNQSLGELDQKRQTLLETEAKFEQDRKEFDATSTELADQQLQQLESDLETLRFQRDQLVDELKIWREGHTPEGAVAAEDASISTDDSDSDENAELREALDRANSRFEVCQERLEESRSHAQELQAKIDQLPQEKESISPESTDEEGEYKRRYDMALDDLRELQEENRQLQEQMKSAESNISNATDKPSPTVSAPPAPLPGGSLDWEAQKRQMLASLETDSDQAGETDQADRLEIEKLIERTDRIIAEKDREIAELQQVLHQQSSQVGEVAVGVGAFAEVLDQDSIVTEGRENIKKLQDDLQEKLRQAEVEISIERAKLSRERTEIEQKLSELKGQNGLDKDKINSPSDSPGASEGSSRRWFSTLGIGRQDDR